MRRCKECGAPMAGQGDRDRYCVPCYGLLGALVRTGKLTAEQRDALNERKRRHAA